MYDNYVSLGRNCETALQFRRVLKRDVAYYFNWLLTPFSSLIDIISNDFRDAYLAENLQATDIPEMIIDRRYNMKYHSPFKHELGGDLSGPRFYEIYVDAFAKYRFLAQRFRDLAASPNRVLYFIKTPDAGAKEMAITLRDILASRHRNHSFDLIILQEENKREDDWGEPNIYNRYLERFAPFNNAHDGHVPSWDRIFAEFPLKPGAMQKPI